jgi:hypothetical protein
MSCACCFCLVLILTLCVQPTDFCSSHSRHDVQNMSPSKVRFPHTISAFMAFLVAKQDAKQMRVSPNELKCVSVPQTQPALSCLKRAHPDSSLLFKPARKLCAYDVCSDVPMLNYHQRAQEIQPGHSHCKGGSSFIIRLEGRQSM